MAVLDRLPENERQRLKLGNWEYDDDPANMIASDTIDNIFTNDFVKPGQKYIICDVARYGSDKARITYWDGLILKEQISFDISSTTDIQKGYNSIKNEKTAYLF